MCDSPSLPLLLWETSRTGRYVGKVGTYVDRIDGGKIARDLGGLPGW